MGYMDEAVKAEWVEALRSGRYAQAEAALHIVEDDGTDSYCCLGVLCEIAVRHGVIERYDSPIEEICPVNGGKAVGYTSPTSREPQGAVLPREVSNWAGLPDGNPDVQAVPPDTIEGYAKGVPTTTTLASVNDSWGYDFKQIADLIEKNL